LEYGAAEDRDAGELQWRKGAAQSPNGLSLRSSDLPDRRRRTCSLGMTPTKPRDGDGLLTLRLVYVRDRSGIARHRPPTSGNCADRQAPILSRERRFGRKRVYRTSTLSEGHACGKACMEPRFELNSDEHGRYWFTLKGPDGNTLLMGLKCDGRIPVGI